MHSGPCADTAPTRSRGSIAEHLPGPATPQLWRSGLVFTVIAGVFTAACSSDPTAEGPLLGGRAGEAGADSSASPAAGSAGMAGASAPHGQAGAAGAGSTCSATDTPDDAFEDSNCDGVDGDARHAVFVAPTGDDEAPGNRDAPVATLQRGIELAVERNHDVYVCNGTYAENVKLTSAVSLYGGYDCTRDWQRVKDWAVVAPATGLPLMIEGVAQPMRIERMAFRSVPGTAPSESSQAAGVIDSAGVVFSRVEFVSGSGAHGVDGEPGVNAEVNPSTDGASGRPGQDCDGYSIACARVARGGHASLVQTCTLRGVTHEFRTSSGGDGGNVYLALGGPASCCPTTQSDPGKTASPPTFRDVTNGTARSLTSDEIGRSGIDGTHGVGATDGVGTIEGGIHRATNAGMNGTDGTHGMPGRSGRGGDSHGVRHGDIGGFFHTGGGGGQGGLGGCAGSAAMGGGAGGGSIALVVVRSKVELFFPRFVTSHGGAGGDGAAGGQAQPGGSAGNAGAGPSPRAQGQSGQAGGRGGHGGNGGPGGGGPSVAVLYSGDAPLVKDAVYTLGLPGSGGRAHSGANTAPNGAAGEIVEFESALNGAGSES